MDVFCPNGNFHPFSKIALAKNIQQPKERTHIKNKSFKYFMFLNYPKWTQNVTQIVNGGCHKPLLHLKLINTHAANFWNLVNSTRTAIWAV